MPKVTEVTNTWTESCTYLAEQLEKLEQRVYELEHPEAVTTQSLQMLTGISEQPVYDPVYELIEPEGDDTDAGDSV